MKNKELIRTIKFTLFSISAGVIQILSYTAITEFTGWKHWQCYLISLVLSVLWNFTLNREFTFKSANNVPIAMLKVAAFYCVFTPVTTFGGNYLVEILGWNNYIVEILSMILNFVTEYIYDRFFVFGATIDTKEKKYKEREV